MDDANLFLTKHETVLTDALQKTDGEIKETKKLLKNLAARREKAARMDRVIKALRTCNAPGGWGLGESRQSMFVRSYAAKDGVLLTVAPLVIPSVVGEGGRWRPTPETRENKQCQTMVGTTIPPKEVVDELLAWYPHAGITLGMFADAGQEPCADCSKPAILMFTYLPPETESDCSSFRYESFHVERVCFDCARIDEVAKFVHKREYRSERCLTDREIAERAAVRESIPLLKAFT